MSRKAGQKARGYSAVGLWHPKTASNIGTVLRAAHCFNTALVAIEGARYHRANSDTPAGFRHLPVIHTESLSAIVPFDCVPIAVEVGASRDLTDFVHPERAFYVFGPEDGSLPDEVLRWCKQSVYIKAGCLNLATACAIVLYDRAAKMSRKIDSPATPATPPPSDRAE